jgi:hypothetical protein
LLSGRGQRMSKKLEKAMAENMAAGVRLLALVTAGDTDPKLDEKGMHALAKSIVAANTGEAELESCRAVIVDKGSHWSVRAAAVQTVNEWFSHGPGVRPPWVSDERAREAAIACVSEALGDENEVVRQAAQGTVDKLRGS